MPFNDIEPDRLPRGVKLCIDNAKRLLDDARLLRDNKRFPSALEFAIFAYEELGKAIYLRDRWRKDKPIKHKDWDKLLLHPYKSYLTHWYIRMSTGQGFQSEDKEFLQQLKVIENKMLEFAATELSKNEKNTYLYVDWTAKGWISPHDPFMFDEKKLVQPSIESLVNRRITEVGRALEMFLRTDKTEKLILEAPEVEWIDADRIQREIMLKLLRFDQSIKVETVIKSDRITKVTIKNSGSRFSGQEKHLIVSYIKELPTMKKTKFFFVEQ